jgi:hypothetical protein
VIEIPTCSRAAASLVSAKRQSIGRGDVELRKLRYAVLAIVTRKKLAIKTSPGLTL